MKFQSVNKRSPSVGFRDALFQGIAPDGGLYVPETFPSLDSSLFDPETKPDLHSIGTHILSLFIDEIPVKDLSAIVTKSWNFPISLVKSNDNLYLLELFHGPTLAFKDIGARFMAQAMSYFLGQDQQELTILVATSGDTGSAVANGFFNVPHIKVLILYPAGKISSLQQQQMTTLGGNITAIQVQGTFDDCQRLVKSALADHSFENLTTANSINVGRLLPQITYYAWAVAQLRKEQVEPPLVVVPSGNLGNLTAAVYAKSMGTPIRSFVAATNANDGVLQYLHSGTFIPRPGIHTYSNAMDVGNPSNLARLQFLYDNNIQTLKNDIDAVSISDDETLQEMKSFYAKTQRILDPHTAVGVAAARKAREWMTNSPPIIVVSTAHPAKFQDIVEKAIGVRVPLPSVLQEVENKPTYHICMQNRYSECREILKELIGG